jgi:glutamate formiminotransferase/formiminotetrahydrofolate cyclodeaminase
MKLVEVIPNFSEGRRPEVIEAIVAAVISIDGVQLLDRHSDEDHNRTVVTFVAEPKAASEAAYAGIAVAAELIDLESHIGEHPRIGATDVVPFVPVRDVSMEECVQLARSLGKRVAEELNIPVYLYEAAATRPDRENLANIRRGEYEELKSAIEDDPAKEPDFGPHKVGPAGATVIGARKPLIAFNVYLTSDDVSIAKRIAKAVRHSGGGLRFVKALGLLVEGRAQVSMNLTDYTRTPIYRVVELIRREAERHGIGIHHSELVGLAPQPALVESAGWYMQLDDFEHDQILENRLLESVTPADSSLLDELAAGSATPGGGSAAAHAGAMGAALVAMVARLTLGKKKYAKVQARVEQVLQETERLRSRLTTSIDEDARAFDSVMAALKLPKDTADQKQARAEALEDATRQAGEVPLGVAGDSAEVLKLAAGIAAIGNLNAITDAGVAARLAHAAIHGAGLNVRINGEGLQDRALAQDWMERIDALEAKAADTLAEVHQALSDRADLPT